MSLNQNHLFVKAAVQLNFAWEVLPPPQLIQTARPSFYRNASNARYHSDSLSKNSKDKGPSDPKQFSLLASESPFSYSSPLRRQEIKGYLFHASDLPTIASNYSEGSNVSEVSPQSSFSSSSELLKRPKSEKHRRESRDERSSKYLLSLAVRSTRKQLKGQALAAFPDEQSYRPIDHFGTSV